jgi:hypothetical protein
MLTAEEYRRAEFGYTVEESERGFLIHAVVYAVVMTGLITLNALLYAFTDANFPWAVFPLVGWGIGLFAHYLYGYRRAVAEARARQLQIDEFARRERQLV